MNTYEVQNDRIMAALAHISVIIPTVGVIAPIVIWATQKDRSRFVAFQALQATVYQLLMILFWFVGMGCYVAAIFVTIPIAVVAENNYGSTVGAAFPVIPFLVLGLVLLFAFAWVVYGIVAAVMVFQGKNFKYILIGNWLERYLEKGNQVDSVDK